MRAEYFLKTYRRYRFLLCFRSQHLLEMRLLAPMLFGPKKVDLTKSWPLLWMVLLDLQPAWGMDASFLYTDVRSSSDAVITLAKTLFGSFSL